MRETPRPPLPPRVPAGRVPGGPKHARYDLFNAVGAGVWIAPRSGWYWALAYGPGGTGGSTPGTAASGGGGGGAAGRRVQLNRGQPVAYTVSAPGAPTTVSVAGLFALSAGSGQDGGTGFVPPGYGGVGTGGHINRTGGNGAGSVNTDGDPNTNDGPSIAATGGEYGGRTVGGAGAGGGGVGGGAAGFRDILPGVYGEGTGNEGTFPGGGGAGGTVGKAGASGAVAFVYDG